MEEAKRTNMKAPELPMSIIIVNLGGGVEGFDSSLRQIETNVAKRNMEQFTALKTMEVVRLPAMTKEELVREVVQRFLSKLTVWMNLHQNCYQMVTICKLRAPGGAK